MEFIIIVFLLILISGGSKPRRRGGMRAVNRSNPNYILRQPPEPPKTSGNKRTPNDPR